MRSDRCSWALSVWVLALAALCLPQSACFAHEFGPAKVVIRPAADGGCRIEFEVFPDHLPAVHALPTGRDAIDRWCLEFLGACALVVDGGRRCELTPAALPATTRAASETQASAIVLHATSAFPERATSFTWSHDWPLATYMVRVEYARSEDSLSQWIDGGEVTRPFSIAGDLNPAPRSWQTAAEYVYLGFSHIVPKGLDHILFVLGLSLQSRRLRPLLGQVTAFTVAHSMTLALATLGFVRISPSIVEPLIAISIVLVAIENVVVREVRATRVALVFAFGLLHGLGFAGVLSEFELPPGQFAAALLSFNVGVELGQLAVIAGAFLAVGVWCRRAEWYRARVVIPASMAIAAVGMYWSVERLAG